MRQAVTQKVDGFSDQVECGATHRERIRPRLVHNDQPETATERKVNHQNFHWADFSYNLLSSLNSIMGVAELMKDTDLTPEQRDYMNIIMSAGADLQTLNEDILAMSFLEERRAGDEKEFDIAVIANEAKEETAELAAKKAIFVSLHIETGLQTAVYGNPVWLRQALANLLKMVISETDMGVVMLRINAAPDGGVRFCIKGAGPDLKDLSPQMSAGYHVLQRQAPKLSAIRQARSLRATEDMIERMGGDWKLDRTMAEKPEAAFILRFAEGVQERQIAC